MFFLILAMYFPEGRLWSLLARSKEKRGGEILLAGTALQRLNLKSPEHFLHESLLVKLRGCSKSPVPLAFPSGCLAGRTNMHAWKRAVRQPGYFHFKEVTRVCSLQLISLSQTADRLLDSTAGRTAKPVASRKSILDLLNAKDKHEETTVAVLSSVEKS